MGIRGSCNIDHRADIFGNLKDGCTANQEPYILFNNLIIIIAPDMYMQASHIILTRRIHSMDIGAAFAVSQGQT
jgi:hypothetical protein